MKLPFEINLKDKVVVITGAGGIICSALAEAMAMNGAKVALLDLNEVAAQNYADQIVAKGYAAGKAGEKVAEIMPIYSINAGGNIVMGESYKAEGWKVGVQDPDAALFISDDPYVCTLQAKNCAIVTK